MRTVSRSIRIAVAVAAVAATMVTLTSCASGLGRITDYAGYGSRTELCDAANLVVTGTVVSSKLHEEPTSFFSPDPMPRLVTTVEVTSVLSGEGAEAADTIEVVQYGDVSDSKSKTDHLFQFTAGDDYVFFIGFDSDDTTFLINPAQGAYSLASDGTLKLPPSNWVDEMDGLPADETLCAASAD